MERTSEEIIELARREIAARKERERDGREVPWRFAFIGLLGAILAGMLLWPGTPLNWKMYAAVHGVCAQVHNVSLGGEQLPLCARNTGIYSGFLLTFIYLLLLGRERAAKLPPPAIVVALVALVVVMAVDGFNSLFVDLFLPHLYTPRNELRTLTGLGMGVSLAVAILLVLNLSLRRDPDMDQPVIGNWRELGGALLLGFLVHAAIYGNVAITYWPIAIVAWTGHRRHFVRGQPADRCAGNELRGAGDAPG
jgi:Predicted membrane protein